MTASSNASMVERLRGWARSIKRDVHALYLSARDPRVPWYAKAVALAVAAYALSPIDLIPDFIPVLGYLDELIILPLGILLAVRLIPPAVFAEHRATATAAPMQPSRGAAAVIIAIWIGLALVAHWRGHPLSRAANIRRLVMQRLVAATGAALVVAAALAITHPSHSAPPAPTGVRHAHDRAGDGNIRGRLLLVDGVRIRQAPGVKQTVSGFMGGTTPDPTYDQVSHGNTGHAESVQVTYDPKVISYPTARRLLLAPRRPARRRRAVLRSRRRISPGHLRAHAGAESRRRSRASRRSMPATASRRRLPWRSTTPARSRRPRTTTRTSTTRTRQYYKRYRVGCGHDARLKEIWGAEADTAAH